MLYFISNIHSPEVENKKIILKKLCFHSYFAEFACDYCRNMYTMYNVYTNIETLIILLK